MTPRIRRTLPPDLNAVDRFCQEVGQWLKAQQLDTERFPILMLLYESLANAAMHGCNRSSNGRVRCEVRRGRFRIGITVTDTGSGFGHAKAWNRIPSTRARHGRGLAIYRMYAHRVIFNAKGNRVSFSRLIAGG